MTRWSLKVLPWQHCQPFTWIVHVVLPTFLVVPLKRSLHSYTPSSLRVKSRIDTSIPKSLVRFIMILGPSICMGVCVGVFLFGCSSDHKNYY